MAESKRKKGDDMDSMDGGGKFVAQNWNKKTKDELKKMAPQAKSRYLAYEEPPKEAAEAANATKKRLMEEKKRQRAMEAEMMGETDEHELHEKLIGQLKAAEARNRIRIMRMRYEANRGQEINHLIACQPTARKAVRLQALLPIRHEDRSPGDKLSKIAMAIENIHMTKDERSRVEEILEDTRGLTTSRT